MNPRAEITIWCIILAFWTYLGVGAYFREDWSTVGAAAFWIVVAWKYVWSAYDQAEKKKG